MTFWYSLQNTLCIAEYKAFKTPFFKMHFLWFSYLKGQPCKHDFVAAGETARCHMSEKDELQSPPQQKTADHNLTSLPNVSIIVSFPYGHLCENTWLICLFQSPILSLCIRNHHCHLIFQTPSLFSCSTWAPLQCDGCDCSTARGTENAKASTENEIRHQKSISPALMSEQTNNSGGHAPPPTFQSLVPQMIQRHCHRSPRVLRKNKKKPKMLIFLQFLQLVCMSETEKQDKSIMQLGAFLFIATGRITIWECSSSFWLILGAVVLGWGASSAYAMGLPANNPLSWENAWSQPPEGTGKLPEVLRLILLLSWLLSKSKMKNCTTRLLRQIITVYSKKAKDEKEKGSLKASLKMLLYSYYMIKLELPTKLQPVVNNIAIKVSTLFTLFPPFKMLLVNFAQTRKQEQHSKARIACE